MEKKLLELLNGYVKKFNDIEILGYTDNFYTEGSQDKLISVIYDLCKLLNFDCQVHVITACGYVRSEIDIKANGTPKKMTFIK